MSTYFIDSNNAQIFSFTGHGIPSKMSSDNMLLYIWQQGFNIVTTKNGEVHKKSYISGKTPRQAFEKSYGGQLKRVGAEKGQLRVRAFIIINRKPGKDKNYDKDIHNLINTYHAINPTEFPFYCPKDDEGNMERIENFDYERDINSLLRIYGEYTGVKDIYFIDKKEFSYRNNTQGKIAKEIIKLLLLNNKVLFNGHTGLGKSTISPKILTELLQSGDICLMTTPIVDTISSILQNIEAFNYGKKIKYFTNDDLDDKNILKEILEAKKQGYIIFLVFSVQNVRFKDKQNELGKLRNKFSFLNSLDVKLWIRDEYHKEYNGIKTSKVLGNINSQMILDLTASIYKLMSLYGNEYVTEGVIYPWDIFDAFREKKNKNPDYSNFPDVMMESIDFNSPLLKNTKIYFQNPEEEYLPKKFFEVEKHIFKNENDILDLFRLKYDGVYNPSGKIINLPKSKNSFTINNDNSLSNKEVGMIIIPEGNNNKNTREIGFLLKELLNKKTQKRLFYTADDFLNQKKKGKTNYQIVEDWIKYAVSLGKDGICIITHRQLTTGTDITQLGFLDVYDNISSPDEFIQIIGRLTRIYDGKDITKVYLNCPGMSIKTSSIMYQLVKDKTSDVKEQKKLYDCMPIIDLMSGKTNNISFDDAINNYNEDFNRFIKNNKISSAYLSKFDSMLQLINSSDFDKLKTGKSPKGEISEKNKGKNEINDGEAPDFEFPEDDETGEDYKVPKKNKSKLETIAVMLSESLSIAVLEKHDSLKSVFDINKNGLAKKYFKEKNLILIGKALNDVEFSKSINNWFDKNLQKFNLLPLEDLILSDELSLNQDFKAKMGLVYIPSSFAQIMINKIVENLKNPKYILVVNALDGKLPLLLKKIYPKSEIICIEHFNYYVDHLNKLGFKVYRTKIIGNELIFPKELEIMKFDLIVGNPPYNDTKDNNDLAITKGKGNQILWDKFVIKAFDLLKDNGYLCFVHPALWRKPEYYLWEEMTNKQLIYLEIHNTQDGLKTFNSSTRYDWYILQNTPYKFKTEVVDENGKKHNINLKNLNFLSNFDYKILIKYLANKDEDTCDVIYGSSSYHTQKNHISKEKTKQFKYPVVYKIYKDGSIKFIYSNINTNGHFDIPKVIISKEVGGSKKISPPINDFKGEYAVAEFCFSIPIKNKKDGDLLIKFLTSDKFNEMAYMWNTVELDYRIFKYFKKDFWKIN